MTLELFPVIEYEPNKFIRNYYFRITFINDVVKTKQTSFFKYILQHGDTPENLSMRFYGSDKYWYLILTINNIEDPFYEWILSDVDCMNYAKKYVEVNYPLLSGDDKDSKVSQIYTKVIEDNTQKEILLPNPNIVHYLQNEFTKLAKSFKN